MAAKLPMTLANFDIVGEANQQLKGTTGIFVQVQDEMCVSSCEVLPMRKPIERWKPSWSHGYVCQPAHLEASSKDKWSPALQIRTVLLSIQAPKGPNHDDTLQSFAVDISTWRLNRMGL